MGAHELNAATGSSGDASVPTVPKQESDITAMAEHSRVEDPMPAAAQEHRGYQGVARVVGGVGEWVQEKGLELEDGLHFFTHDFTHPAGVKKEHKKVVKWLGRLGWVGKGVMYAIIGGLACRSAARGTEADSSPQGAFALVGANNATLPILIVIGVCIALYTMWRYWEGITGQGSDEEYSKTKNFFKFRLSPMVSGIVYTGYLFLILILIVERGGNSSAAGSFPEGWKDSWYGMCGLALLGTAFAAAFIVQLETTVRSGFHADYRTDLDPRYRTFVLVIGHIGYIGRALFFVMLSVLFYREMVYDVSGNQSAVGKGLAQLQGQRWGRALLFIIGFALIVYGLFAVLSAHTRYFPTPPPSRRARHISVVDPSKYHSKWGQKRAQEEVARAAAAPPKGDGAPSLASVEMMEAGDAPAGGVG